MSPQLQHSAFDPCGNQTRLLKCYEAGSGMSFRSGKPPSLEAKMSFLTIGGQTWQQSYSRPACRLPDEVVDFTAGQDCDETQPRGAQSPGQAEPAPVSLAESRDERG
jgi:hypothetical protein